MYNEQQEQDNANLFCKLVIYAALLVHEDYRKSHAMAYSSLLLKRRHP